MRKRRRDRGIVGIITVTVMAACILIGYGIINLFIDNSSTEVVANATKIDSQDTTSSTSLEKKEDTSSSASAEVSEEIITEKKKLTSKKSIEELVTSTKEIEEKYYKDTAFIGDSRTQGLQISAGLTSPNFFAGRGLNIKSARTEKVVKNRQKQYVTVIDALKDKKYKKVYICFGINELGWPNTTVFINEYKTTIEEIKKVQPEAKIVVLSIFPVTEKKSSNDKIFNMKNIKKFNKLIKGMTKEIGVKYANVSPAVANKKGFLPAEVTPDGIHMNSEYCKRILAYICNKKY